MTPLIQMQFRLKRALYPNPDRALIERLGREWVETGKLPAGVQIRPIVWAAKGPRNVRRYLQGVNLYFGCPGVVESYARPNLTMCDYDTGEKSPDLGRIFRLGHTLGLKARWIRYDRTVRGWHVSVEWNRRLTPAVTVAMQAILGSDPARETFNLCRVLSGKAGNKRWNLLFSRKLNSISSKGTKK